MQDIAGPTGDECGPSKPCPQPTNGSCQHNVCKDVGDVKKCEMVPGIEAKAFKVGCWRGRLQRQAQCESQANAVVGKAAQLLALLWHARTGSSAPAASFPGHPS